MASKSEESGPPLASSWAEPLEFYFDENAVTKTVVRTLKNLGYRCHTPAEVFGTLAKSQGIPDEQWLAKVAGSGWVVLNRDTNIMQRPDELLAYKKSGLHMFYLPGEARRDELRELVETNLREILVQASSKRPNVWRVTHNGVSLIKISPSSGRSRRS